MAGYKNMNAFKEHILWHWIQIALAVVKAVAVACGKANWGH